ncbi:isoflavone reductase [Stemphylium lycopersici]|nr:isoflavone reductase [Stemphylium lycopersici]RAR09857.1 isoflavone reductase [Stemphylium lycopersici]
MLSSRKILLLGAGELGTSLLTHLATLPSTQLTLGIRSPSKYTHLISKHPSLTLLPIDLSSPSHILSNIFSAFDIVISATGFSADPETVLKLANEILEAGKIKMENRGDRLWFFPWQWGVDYDVTEDGQGLMPLFGAQRDVRNLLRQKAAEGNVSWTIVSTGIFMSFLFEPFWGIVDRTAEADGKIVVRCLRDWEHAVSVTDVDDIGKVLARILLGEVEAKNLVLYVAGDTVSYGRLAEILGRVSGKSVEKVEWPIEHLEQELKADPEDGIKKYQLVFARDGVWWDTKRTVNHELGMSMIDVETYAWKLFGNGRKGQ